MRPMSVPFTTGLHGFSGRRRDFAPASARTRRASACCRACGECARLTAFACWVSARSTAFTYLRSSARPGPEQAFATEPRKYRRWSLARSWLWRDFLRYASIEETLFTRTKRFGLGRGRLDVAIAAMAS